MNNDKESWGRERNGKEYDKCLGCGESIPGTYYGKGYCRNCYVKLRYRKNKGLPLENLDSDLRYSQEFRTKQSEIRKEQWDNQESFFNTQGHKTKMRESHRTPELRAKMSEITKRNRSNSESIYNTLEYKKKLKASCNTLEKKEKQSKIMREQWSDLSSVYNTSEHRETKSKAQKENWSNPEYRDRILQALANGRKFSNTKPEKVMRQLLKDHFPNINYEQDIVEQYYFEGLGLGAVDFYIESQDLAIEVDGDYWHSELDRIFYDNYKITTIRANGHNGLRILASELYKNPDKVIKVIKKEINRIKRIIIRGSL